MLRSKLISFQCDTTQPSNIHKECGSPALHLYCLLCAVHLQLVFQPLYEQEGYFSHFSLFLFLTTVNLNDSRIVGGHTAQLTWMLLSEMFLLPSSVQIIHSTH